MLIGRASPRLTIRPRVDAAEFRPTVPPGSTCAFMKRSAKTLTNKNASDSFIPKKFLQVVASGRSAMPASYPETG